MKVVINTCFGGFGLSYAGMMKYAELKGIKFYAFTYKTPGDHNTYRYADSDAEECTIHYTSKPLTEDGKYEDGSYVSYMDFDRDDPVLVKIVEELGEKANDCHSKLKIVEIPDGTDYYIHDYDGNESIHEKHRSWS